MTKLRELCSLVRSKNAGPFVLTFDIMFTEKDKYESIKKLNSVNKELISNIYNKPTESITLVYHDQAMAIKISFPRDRAQGGLNESDCYGGQQYLPLMNLDIKI